MSWSTSSDTRCGSGSSATSWQSFRHSSSFFLIAVMEETKASTVPKQKGARQQALRLPNRSHHTTYTAALSGQESRLYEEIARKHGVRPLKTRSFVRTPNVRCLSEYGSGMYCIEKN